MMLVVSAKNLNDGPILISRRYRSLLAPVCKDESGKVVPWTRRGLVIGEVPTSGPLEVTPSFVLEPGCAVALSANANAVLEVSQPGNYTAIAGLDLPPLGRLVAAPVRFSVATTSVGPLESGTIENEPSAPKGSFAATWRRMVSLAGKPRQSFVLESLVSPVDRRVVNLVVSVKNVGRTSLPGECPANERLAVPSGLDASEYELLVKDASGDSVPLTEAGQAWMAKHRLQREETSIAESLGRQGKRFVRLGEAVGFVFPLQEMFDVRYGEKYEVVATLPRWGGGTEPLVAGPVTFQLARPEVVGKIRPPYGSAVMWEHLLAAATNRTKIVLACTIANNQADGSVLDLALKNPGNQSLPSADVRNLALAGPDRMVVLLRDDAGSVIAPNENIKTMPMNPHILLRSAGRDLLPGKSTPQCRYPLDLVFPLKAGRRYKVLAAAILNDDLTAFPAAAPIEFTAPGDNADVGQPAETHQPAAKPATVAWDGSSPATFDDLWELRSRFAGKPFDGLQLEASIISPPVPGQPITLQTHLRNHSREAIAVKKWKGQCDYDLLLRDAAGKPVPLTEKGKEFFQNFRLLAAHKLERGKALTETLPLQELFNCKATEEYTVLVSLPIVGDVDAVLTATPVKITTELDRK